MKVKFFGYGLFGYFSGGFIWYAATCPGVQTWNVLSWSICFLQVPLVLTELLRLPAHCASSVSMRAVWLRLLLWLHLLSATRELAWLFHELPLSVDVISVHGGGPWSEGASQPLTSERCMWVWSQMSDWALLAGSRSIPVVTAHFKITDRGS